MENKKILDKNKIVYHINEDDYIILDNIQLNLSYKKLTEYLLVC